MEQPAARLCFGPFVLDVEQASLTRDGESLTVQPQVLDGLRYFAENPGRLISREELGEALWPGVFVGNDTLFQLIRKIRRALGDAPREPRYLETVPRRGYRFVAAVQAEQNTPAPAPVVVSTEAPPIFGRQDALRQLGEALTPGAVVTLTGAGGMGKSHLAGVAAAQLAPCFDGVAVVDLQDVFDGSRLVHTVAATLQVPATDPSTEAVRDRVGRALSSRGSVLVVLDDLDRIEDDARALVGIWRQAAPEVVWLLTCRRPVELADERRIPLGPLSPAGAQALFRARVRTRGGRIAEDDPHLPTLLERLDHSPLAIELAAARTGVMGVETLTRRLDDRFRVLKERHGDRPVRHRSLRACLDASWHRLDDGLKAALAALSVLPGVFDLVTAEALLLQIDAHDDDPLDLIEDLHRDALLHADGSASDGRRLKLLESVRDYVSADVGVAAVCRDARAQLLPVLTSRLDRLNRAATMDPALVQVHLMMTQALEGGSGDTLARALWAASDWLWDHGPRVVATRMLARLKPIAATLSPDAQVMVLLTRIDFEDPDPDERKTLSAEARALAEAHGLTALAFAARISRLTTGAQRVDATEEELLDILADIPVDARPIDVAEIHSQYGRFLLEQGRVVEGTQRVEVGLAQASYGPVRARLLDTLGLSLVRRGRVEEGVEHFAECRAIYGAIGWQRRVCISLLNAGGALVMAGNRALGLDYLQQAREVLPRIGERRMLAGANINLAVQYLFDNSPLEALAVLEEAEPLLAAENLQGWTGTLLHNRTTALWLTGDLTAALAVADQGLSWCEDNGVARQGALLQAWRAGLLSGLGRVAEAEAALAAAEAVITEDDAAAEAMVALRLHVAACHGPVDIPERDWGPRGGQLIDLLQRRLSAG